VTRPADAAARRDSGAWPAALDAALLLLVLALLGRLFATAFLLDLAPEATRAYRLARDPALGAAASLASGGLPWLIALAARWVGPLRAYPINAALLVGVAALVFALARQLGAARAGRGAASAGALDPAARAGAAAALGAWLLANSANRSQLLELVNPYPDPLLCALPLLALWLLGRRARLTPRALALALGLALLVASAAALRGEGRLRASPASGFWLASLAAPLFGAGLARALRAARARLPLRARAPAVAGCAAAAWLACLLALADAGARGWVAPGQIGRESARVRLRDLEALRAALHESVPPGALLAASAPLADLLAIGVDRALVRLDPALAAGPAGEAFLARIASLERARPAAVFACTGAAGARRDPAEQLLAGDFDLIPVAHFGSEALRLGRFLGDRERLELSRIEAWTQTRAQVSLRQERAGDAWLRVDVGRLSRRARRSAQLALGGRALGAVRADLANFFHVRSLAAGSHAVELRSDAPVPRRLEARATPAHAGLVLAFGDPEQALALRDRVEREARAASEGASAWSELRVRLPSPAPARAAFLLELELSLAAAARDAARHTLELRIGERRLASAVLGPPQRSEGGEQHYALSLGQSGSELAGEDTALALRLTAPSPREPLAPLRLPRVEIYRHELGERFELELGRRDRAFLIAGIGGHSQLGPLRVRSVEPRAELYVLVPEPGARAWLELEYVERSGAALPPRFAWDGAALGAGLRAERRIELEGDRSLRLVRERFELAPERAAGAVHRLRIEVAEGASRGAAQEAALLLHRVRVASRVSALDAAAPARGD